MEYYTKYTKHSYNLIGDNKIYDDTIYTFDIEATSYLVLDGKVLNASEYNNLTDKEKERVIHQATMYVWQLSINDRVYYGRTWSEFIDFLNKIEVISPHIKIMYIHNLSYEFQFIKAVLNFSDIMTRKSHKVMSATLSDYNFILKCSYYLSNTSLATLPKIYGLEVQKQVGLLDYDLIRTSVTPLTDDELKYIEYDCLVLYNYIKREIETYGAIYKIPLTSTGKVRNELKEITKKDYIYKALVRRSINTDPHIYNMLSDAFMGGYTHANFMYADEIVKNVDSYDITSSYPYTLVAYKFPSTAFKISTVKRREEMSSSLAYLLKVKFTNIKCKYFNNFISMSKCINIHGGRYDNGRVISAEALEMTLTDIDFYFILDTYTCNYVIEEAYYSIYKYLPKTFIEFVLDKYVKKTEYKGIEELELEYQKEKNKFNSLYGMSVTNTIRDEVVYDNETKLFSEVELTNEEIILKLEEEKKKGFLSFAYGVWVTAIARDNLLRRVVSLDEYVIYCDTDSIKLSQGYDKNIFTSYNESVKEKIKQASDYLGIDINKYAPKDKNGKSHLLGIFESETDGNREYTYDEFITQGAKKYAVKIDGKLKITVAGVPKKAVTALTTLDDFKDDLVFDFKDTGKNILMYIDNQKEFEITDYLGNKFVVNDKSACVLLPTTYVLKKSNEYARLISDESSKRARFKE